MIFFVLNQTRDGWHIRSAHMCVYFVATTNDMCKIRCNADFYYDVRRWRRLWDYNWKITKLSCALNINKVEKRRNGTKPHKTQVFNKILIPGDGVYQVTFLQRSLLARNFKAHCLGHIVRHRLFRCNISLFLWILNTIYDYRLRKSNVDILVHLLMNFN